MSFEISHFSPYSSFIDRSPSFDRQSLSYTHRPLCLDDVINSHVLVLCGNVVGAVPIGIIKHIRHDDENGSIVQVCLFSSLVSLL